MQQCSVRIELGSYVLRGREVELVEVTQEVGVHARCALTFDRDGRVPGPVGKLRLGDLTDARVRVIIVGEDGAEGFECLAFEGHVRKADATYQSTGLARFNVHALSASYALGEHVDRSYRREHTVAQLVHALGAQVVGSLPDGDPRDYVQPGRSAWATLGHAAASEGLQLRPVWPRSPSDPAPPLPAEVGAGFADPTHTLVWGRNLLGFSTSVAPVNPGVTGAFYDPTAKHDHQFVVRARPNWLGGAAPVVSAAERAAETDADGGEPGHVDVGGPGGTRARTLPEFRARLQRESARRLGMSVVATGWSVAPGLRAGDKIDLWASAAAAAGQVGEGDTGSPADTSTDDAAGSAAGGGSYAPGAWVNGPEDADRTGLFGLVQVTHRWNGGLYENQFTATPWADYSPAPAAAAAMGAPAGAGALHEGGLALAIVVANDDPKRRGRVKVRHAWMSEGTETAWIRVAAPGAGNGRGLGWLPHVGDEVVVAAVAGDPEHPVVLGALWNGVDKAAHSPGRTHLVTPGGNALTLIEGKAGEDKEVVELHTRAGKTGVQLAAKGPTGVPTVTVFSGGDISIEAPQGEVRITAKRMTTIVETDVKREVKGTVTDKVTGAVTLTTDARLAMKAGEVAVYATGALTAHADGVQTVHGKPIRLNPTGATPPVITIAAVQKQPSAWGARPVPGPGPGTSTRDPRSHRRSEVAAATAADSPGAPPMQHRADPVAGADAAAPAQGKPFANTTPTTVCRGTGLSAPGVAQTFAKRMQALQQKWPQLPEGGQIAGMAEAVNSTLRDAGIPPLVVDPYSDTSLTANDASFDRIGWKMFVSKDQLGPGKAMQDPAKLSETLFHEARHADQAFLVARRLAAQGYDQAGIHRKMFIPKYVGDAARANPLPMRAAGPGAAHGAGGLNQCAQVLDDLLLGEAGQKLSNDTYDAMQARAAELQTANAAVSNLNASSAPAQSVAAAEKALTAADKAYGLAYTKYKRGLPDEADAWEIGETVKKYFP